MFALLAAALLVAPALQVESRPARRPARESRGLDLPDPPASSPSRGDPDPRSPLRATAPAADWPAGAGRADLLLRECLRSRDPSSPLAREARRALAEMGEAARESVEAALASKHPAVLCVAAEVLDPPSERAQVALRRALEGAPPRDAVRPLLEALLRGRPDRAALELADLLRAPSGAVRMQAAAALAGRVRPEHLPALLAAAREAPPDARERAVEIVAPFDDPDVSDFLLEGLEDASPRVAYACAEAVSRSARLEGRLNERILRGRPDRGWGYGSLALSMREDATLEAAFAPGAEGSLLAGLGAGDPFVSGAAAVGLATIGFRAEDSAASPWLDRAVPAALVACVSTERFFRDFASLSDLALRRLAVLAGDGVPRAGSDWAAWWVGNRGRFRAQRAGLALPPGEERALAVTYEREGPPSSEAEGAAPPLRATLRHEGAGEERHEGGGGPDVESILLSAEEMDALAGAARSSGLLEPRMRPGVRGVEGTGLRRIVFRVGNRRKEVGWSRGAGPAGFAAFEAAVMGFLAANRWQRYFDADGPSSRVAFVRSVRAEVAGVRDPFELAGRWKNLILAAYDDLPEADRVRAVRDLATIPDLPAVFREEDADALVAGLASGSSPSESDRLAVEFLLAARGAAGAGRVAEALARRFGLRGLPLLASAVARAGPGAIRETLAHPLPLVREAGAEAASTAGAEGLGADLGALLDAPEPEVRAAAARALGRIREGESAARLASLAANDPDEEVARAALFALGRIGAPGSLEALQRALAHPSERIRGAAIEGLAECRDPRAAALLAAVFARGGPVAETARRGLLRLGRGAREALAGHLPSGDAAARRAVRVLLAELGDRRAFPGLLDDLTVAPGDARVADALALLTGIDRSGEPDALERWREWWERNRGRDEREWFLDALRGEGGPSAVRKEDLEEGGDPAVLPALASIVERSSWPLAARAARWASLIGERDFGRVERETSPVDRASLGERIRQSAAPR